MHNNTDSSSYIEHQQCIQFIYQTDARKTGVVKHAMDKTYNPHAIEDSLYKNWETKDYFKPVEFKPVEKQNQEHYSIMIPPPNVTGSLHMGHAFQSTLMDILIRFQRMQGKRTLWLPGTDHAGIATQILVERQIEATGTSRNAIGRDAFTQKVWDWKAKSGGAITTQMRRLGASLDWSRERFTMDEGLSQAVKDVFVTLYREDLIYKSTRLVNWDPKLNTSVSDLEVINEEEPGFMWHFQYPLINATADEPAFVEVATTRPETLFGDAAVAVHPDDKRYQMLIGRSIMLPLSNRPIPIIADTYVDPEFGTGCVKITPAHDFNDYEVGQRHNLPQLVVMNFDATLNTNVPTEFQNLDRYDARTKVVAAMDELGLLIKTEPHTLKTPRGERTGIAIEPMLTSQWFVRAKVLAEPAIKAVEDGHIRFVPKNWENTYFAWMRDIQDWCISRQLWWGHQIPAWYDPKGNTYVGQDETDVRAYYALDNSVTLTRDEDVLDTWFSSALWTFATLGWPEETKDLADFHPSNVLVTGFDIIFFWVARMIMMTLKFRKQVPFHTVYMHGLVRDAEGKKMSKSVGNVLDPLDLIDGISLDALLKKRTAHLLQPKKAKQIEKATRREFPEGIASYGTDALRFTFCALASTGRDIRFDISRVEGYRNFCNKLWNAARFAQISCLKNNEPKLPANPMDSFTNNTSIADHWILNQLQETIAKAYTAYETYRFDLLAQTLYQFAWHEFCDWYLELAKITLYAKPTESSTAEAIQAMAQQKLYTRHTCIYVLEQLMRLLHPIMPYITESIWQNLKTPLSLEGDTLMLMPYPSVNTALHNETSAQTVRWTQNIIAGIRNIRGEMQIAHSKKIPLLLAGGTEHDQKLTSLATPLITPLAQLESLRWLNPHEQAPPAATHVVGELQVLIPLAGLVNINEERARLTKHIDKIKKEQDKALTQINNERFVAHAPETVVAQVRQTIETTTSKLNQYTAQLEELNKLENST